MKYPHPPSGLCPPSPELKALLEQQPRHRPLPLVANFIHQCSPDLSVRTNLVTQFVLSIWQRAGGKMSPRLPSLITLSPSAKSRNLARDFAALFLPETSDSMPAHELSQQALILSRARGENPAETILNGYAAAEALSHQRQHTRSVLFADHDTKEPRSIFGKGPCRHYAAAWHSQLGLVTDANNEVILRLENKSDRNALRHHIVHAPSLLTQPFGYGHDAKPTGKNLCLSGTISLSDWVPTLAAKLVDLGLPLLILPGPTEPQPDIPHFDELRKFARLASQLQTPITDEPSNFITGSSIDIFTEEIRKRLHYLPATYEFAIQKMARQLSLVCFNIAHFWGKLSNSTQEEVRALAHDLNEYTLRGVALGLATLSWRGLGFDPECSQDTINRVLKYLRERKPMSKTKLLRGAHLKKEERDKILEVLEKENLIRIEGKTVSTNNFKTFTAALHARHNLTQPENHWATFRETLGNLHPSVVLDRAP